MTSNTLHILIDDRESLPYDFASIRSPVLPFTTTTLQLQTGDYCTSCYGDVPEPGIRFHSDNGYWAVIERKTLTDLYTTLGQHRDRFQREFERMSRFGYAALVIEADWTSIARPNDALDWPTELNPKSVIATLLAWSQRYGVHLFPCPNRNFAEQLTFRLLERWVRDQGLRPLDPEKPQPRTKGVGA